MTHLSKGPSDLKQNGTQEKTLFSGKVSDCLSCGVVLFVPTVSFWNHQIEASHWLMGRVLANQKVVSGANTRNKTDHTKSKDTKTIPENGAFSWVPFCLRSHGRFKRCDYFKR